MPDFIYLASQSPRRRQLLEQMGVRHALLLPGDDEDAEGLEAVLPGESPRAYVRRVTSLKLEAAVQRLHSRALPPAPVLCSDTTVALGRTIYGKPADHADAERMLKELSATTHRVLTCVSLWHEGREMQTLSESRVRFSAMTDAQLKGYVASGEPMGKAGAYAVQGRAAEYIEHISGSYTGIMGLPLYETMQLLRSAGLAA